MDISDFQGKGKIDNSKKSSNETAFLEGKPPGKEKKARAGKAAEDGKAGKEKRRKYKMESTENMDDFSFFFSKFVVTFVHFIITCYP